MVIIGLIDPDESRFTYPPGMTARDFSFPGHVPDFLDEVLAGASQEVMDECGSDSMCVFDATQTGDLAIGIETMTRIETDILNREIVGKSCLTSQGCQSNNTPLSGIGSMQRL